MVRHIQSKHISDIIHSIFTLENGQYYDNESDHFGILKVKALIAVINNIEDLSEEEISNFCEICADMVNKYFNVVDGESMIEVILTE